MSSKTIAMLKALPNKYDPYVFNPTSVAMRQALQIARNSLAAIMHNPRFKQVHLHTFRHWKATMEYHKTKDLLHVMRMLGHRNVNSTLIYTKLLDFEDDEWNVRRPQTSKEEDELTKANFEYVRYDNKEACPIYRKRK